MAGEDLYLTLYVSGDSPNSVRARENLFRFCTDHLSVGSSVEVVDLFLQPERSHTDYITAVPVLVCRFRGRSVRITGDLSDTERILRQLSGRPADARGRDTSSGLGCRPLPADERGLPPVAPVGAA